MKGLKKGARTVVKTVGKIVRNPNVQKLAFLTASVAIPSVGIGALSGVALKWGFDNMLGKDKNMGDVINDMLHTGGSVTRGLVKGLENPTLGGIRKSVDVPFR